MTLWDRAKEIIPGGNCLVSKRPERYHPRNWPAYYFKARGIQIIDRDGREFQDFSTMGAGACILGYSDVEVDCAVLDAIKCGQSCSLNCEEEVELAETLLALNPKMDMVRFARTGGEACAIAARIARTYNHKDESLQHGYSGWHLGNPEHSYRSITFDDLDNQIRAAEPFAAMVSYIIMEPVRNHPHRSIRLMKEAQKYANAYGIPLIIDEITAGYRCNLGGWHQLHGIEPDMIVYGKAMGNGYPIAAVLGKREIMEAAEKTFISSTMWSERIGFTAALATLDKLNRCKVAEHIGTIGTAVMTIWRETADVHGLDIEVMGIPPLAHFEFREDPDNAKMTLFTQEMLKRGFLAAGQFYPSYAHRAEDVAAYEQAVSEVFADIAAGTVVLEGPPASKGWRRMN